MAVAAMMTKSHHRTAQMHKVIAQNATISPRIEPVELDRQAVSNVPRTSPPKKPAKKSPAL